MNGLYITTTELRTKSAELVSLLAAGSDVNLVHRSQIIGRVIPKDTNRIKTISAKKLQRKINKLDFPRLTAVEIDRRYRLAMMEKHGQGIS